MTPTHPGTYTVTTTDGETLTLTTEWAPEKPALRAVGATKDGKRLVALVRLADGSETTWAAAQGWLCTTWFHATTEAAWQDIQDEGVLWGKPNSGDRHTFLAADLATTQRHGGTVLLQVEHTPGTRGDGYTEDGAIWLVLKVCEPIPLSAVVRVGA